MTIDTNTNKFGYQSYTATVDSGEFLAEVEFCFTPGEAGDYFTPGTGDDYDGAYDIDADVYVTYNDG